MSENKFGLDDLMSGLGVIANVMLIGQSMGLECEDNPQMLENYRSLCEVTEKYTQLLIENGSEVEKNWRADHVEAQKFRNNICPINDVV